MSDTTEELTSSQSLNLLMNEIERLCNVNKPEDQHFFISHKVRTQIVDLFNEEVESDENDGGVTDCNTNNDTAVVQN